MQADTPNSQCQASCQAPTADGFFLCRHHITELADALRSVPALLEDLEVTITRQARTGGQKHGSRSSTTPLPWNDHASTCKHELNAIIHAWAYETSQIGEDDRDPLAALNGHRTAERADWLRVYLPTYGARHELAGDMYAEIRDAITQATRAVDLPPDRKFIGVCNHQPADWDKPCREDLYAMPNQKYVTCRGCTERHDADTRREEMLARILDQAATTGVLAGLITGLGKPIGASTIRKYAVEHSFHVVSRDRNGRPRYLVRDVLEILDKRTKRDRGPADAAA